MIREAGINFKTSPSGLLVPTTADNPSLGAVDVYYEHANSGVTAGTYGDATHVAQVTVDAKGHVTGVSAVAITGGGGGGSASIPAASTTLPASPATGDLALLTDSTTTPTYQWLLQYDGTITSAHKWRALSGVPLSAKIPTSGDAGESLTNGSWSNLTTVGPTVTLPVAGLYLVRLGAYINAGTNVGLMGFTRNGANPPDDSEAAGVNWGGATGGGTIYAEVAHDFTSIGTSAAVTAVYRTGASPAVTFYRRRLTVVPILLG